MPVSYTNVTENLIMSALKVVLDTEFVNVYVGKFRELQTESMQLFFDDPAMETNVVSNMFDDRKFFIFIRYYIKSDNQEMINGYLERFSDRLRRLLNNNIVNSTNWHNLQILEESFIDPLTPDESLTVGDIPGVLFRISLDNYSVFT
jgi:hypothetical protein